MYKSTLSLVLLVYTLLTPTLAWNKTAEWKALSDLSLRLSGRSINFPSDETRELFKSSGKYIPRNIIATRMQIYKYDVVVAQPRYKSGVPVTLGLTQLQKKGTHTVVEPFPSWYMQQEGDCNAIQSAVDIYLDRRNILWVLDAGTVNTLEIPSTKCPPKIISICMESKKIIYTIDLSNFTVPKSNLQYIVAENAGNGDDYVYVSDATGKALIIYNASAGKGRRLLLPCSVMSECEKYNALYLSILMKADSQNYLYFTYLESTNIYSVETSTLHDDDSQGEVKVAGKKPGDTKIVFIGTDGYSDLYFRPKSGTEIFRWDSNTPLRQSGWQAVQRGQPERQITQVAPGPWKLLWIMQTNVNDYVAGTTGCLGASTILHPLARDID